MEKHEVSAMHVSALATLLIVAAVDGAAGAHPAASAGTMLCGMTQKGLEACQPAVSGKKTGATTGPAPSAACCAALARADLPCLCKFMNDNPGLLEALNIDPKLATQLPAKCRLHNLPTKC